jgi:hypothetical protein
VKNQPKSNNTHVLIIGIDQYDSPNLPRLQGARNDAIAWYRLCVDHLRIAPENITVLASPRLTAAELGPRSGASRLRGATRTEIMDEARRLADAAVSTAGLVTFAGHGVALPAVPGGAVGMDLSLCPSDTRVELPEGGHASVSGSLRFSDLAAIFASQDCKDNITVVLDTCYSDGPGGPTRGPLGSSKPLAKAAAKADELTLAKQILRVDAFTNRLFLGARHWTTAYEIKVGGVWRGAASYAMQTLIERWALRQENGILYPNVSHADLLDAMRDFFDVLGVPQLPAVWGQRRIDELPVLRPGLRFTPAETSPRPNARMNARQMPVDPDKIALISIKDQNDNPIIHVIAVGESVPSGVTGYNERTEYWYTNTTSAPTLTGLNMEVTTTTSQQAADNFRSGYTLSIECEQLIGQENWSTWSNTVNTAGTLFRADDPTEVERYLGLYLEYLTNGHLNSYAWYRMTLLEDGFAYDSVAPSEFIALEGTDPNEMEEATWNYSLLVYT